MRPVTFGFLLTVGVTAAGSSFQFYTFAVLNTPQTIIQEWINQSYFGRNGHGLRQSGMTIFWSFLISSICVGAFIGCVLTRPLAESCGRRNALIANGVVSVFGGLCGGISKGTKSPELLFLARIVLGMGMGLSSSLAPMYLTEIAPVRLRGAAGTVHMIAVAFGDWFSLCMSLPQIFGSERLWPLAVVFPVIPALVLCVVLPFCPESPRFLLISMNRREASKKAIRFFVGKDEADGEFQTLLQEAARTAAGPDELDLKFSHFIHRKELRTPLLISLLVMVAQQFTGAAAIFAYSTEIFTRANLSVDNARLATLGMGIGYFFCTLPSPYLIEEIGRRKLSLFQLNGCLCSLILVTVFTVLQKHFLYTWTAYANIAAMVLFMCVYGVGSPIPWMITSELFAQEYRSVAVGLSTFTSWFLAFLISTLYLPFQNAVGSEYSFLPFIVVLGGSILGIALLLPETKNKTIDEIVAEFRERKKTISRRLTYAMLPTTITTPELQTLIEEADDNQLSATNTTKPSRYGSLS